MEGGRREGKRGEGLESNETKKYHLPLPLSFTYRCPSMQHDLYLPLLQCGHAVWDVREEMKHFPKGGTAYHRIIPLAN